MVEVLMLLLVSMVRLSADAKDIQNLIKNTRGKLYIRKDVR